MSECKQCGKALDNPRASFCSDAHRMAFNRSQPEQVDPNKPDPNTQPEQAGIPLPGDPGYKGVCMQHGGIAPFSCTPRAWAINPARKRMTRAQQKFAYAKS